MVIDSSALIAILLGEDEQVRFNRLISQSSTRLMSVASLLEISIVIERKKGHVGKSEIDAFVARAGIKVTPVDLDQGEVARDAFSRYGKGLHPAGLNFGDCFSYALAITTGEPLLFKGTDFAKTDVGVATADA
jgi:ribonuclease VapC